MPHATPFNIVYKLLKYVYIKEEEGGRRKPRSERGGMPHPNPFEGLHKLCMYQKKEEAEGRRRDPKPKSGGMPHSLRVSSLSVWNVI